MDKGASKRIVQDWVDFVNFHYFPVGSWIVVLRNEDEEDILELRTYHLNLYEGTRLFLHDALYAHQVQCSLVSFALEISFLFDFHLDVLDIIYNGNLFGHATLKWVFNVRDKIEQLLSLPHFRLCFRLTHLDHEGQDTVIKLAKYSLLRAPH